MTESNQHMEGNKIISIKEEEEKHFIDARELNRKIYEMIHELETESAEYMESITSTINHLRDCIQIIEDFKGGNNNVNRI